jgi:cytoskeletal protein CcmA (bactofilin family)
MDSKNQ